MAFKLLPSPTVEVAEILPGTDRDLVRRVETDVEAVCLETKVAEMEERDGQVKVTAGPGHDL